MGPDDRQRGQAYRPVSSAHARAWGAAVIGRQPMLVINPIADPGFVRLCNEAMLSGPARPDELQSMLRRDYPAAVVRPRSLSGELTTIWYVYRDGHWVSSA